MQIASLVINCLTLIVVIINFSIILKNEIKRKIQSKKMIKLIKETNADFDKWLEQMKKETDNTIYQHYIDQ